jgi:hypothetical protein
MQERQQAALHVCHIIPHCAGEPSFTLDHRGGLVSTMLPDGLACGLLVGTRVYTTRELDQSPHALIRAGERGTVRFVGLFRSLRIVEIRWDTPYRGLHYWDNTTTLVPFGCEDILDGIRCILGT